MVKVLIIATLTMLAFASNSLLNRAALTDGITGPAAFAAIRTLSGAFFLMIIVSYRGAMPRLSGRDRWTGTAALLVYMLGFSFAYIALDAGTGALILFGVVQVTMFTGALVAGERPAAGRWIGMAVAFGGLIWLLWPTAADAPEPFAAAMMAIAAVAWGVYSLVGRRADDALAETGANFLLAAPFTLLFWLILPDGIDARGILLAVTAGVVTSGLGYAMWYTVLPRIDSSTAALTQLTVPVIALVGGLAFLSEVPTLRMVLASAVVLCGVAYGILAGQRTKGSSAS